MKTKLGISVGLFGAAIYFTALLGGYTPVILLSGYVLLCEENEWLKKTAVKAVALLISIAFLTTLINLIPDLLSWINSLVLLFEGAFEYQKVNSFIGVITGAISIIRICLFLVLGVKALNQSTIAIPFVDEMLEKYL